MRGWLTKNSTLWILFLVTILLTSSFTAVMRIWDFSLIDEKWNVDLVRDAVAAFSPTQRRVHLWTTATLDVAYPIAYGLLFAGLALKVFGKAGPFLALPSFAVIVTDLAEGVVQVMGLAGNMDILAQKAWLTPLKLGLFGLAAIIALTALIVMFARRPRAA
jgi:hypothetical protein